MTAPGLRWRIDNRHLVEGQVRRAAERAVADGTEFLLQEANRTVPIEEATLERSGTATTDGLRGAVAWDTPYAARQHEDLTFRHDPGRRAKWAQRTFTEQRSSIGAFIARRMRGAL